MSLGPLSGLTGRIPARPYLAAAGENRLGDMQYPRVGLVWRGSGLHPQDDMRSLPFEMLTPILAMRSLHCIDLQLDRLVHHPRLRRVPISRCWYETAALLEELDLIITVDTAMAHLAGGLGRPVWLLNRYVTDWRWRLGRTDSDWYASMRIFRQPRVGDWASVIRDVRIALEAF